MQIEDRVIMAFLDLSAESKITLSLSLMAIMNNAVKL